MPITRSQTGKQIKNPPQKKKFSKKNNTKKFVKWK